METLSPMATIVIFGGTGGIGSALARQLTAVGCRIALVARDEGRLESLGRELGADIYRANAADSTAVEQCFAELTQKHGKLYGVVNCVGSLFLKPAHATRDEDWAEVLAVDGGLSSLQSRMASNP